jgi:hypothetical protein
MYFPHAFRKDFFVQSSATGTLSTLLTGTATTALTAGQVGFFVKTSLSGGSSTLVSTNTAATTPFILAQGSYFVQDKISPALGGYSETLKSKTINPRYISRVMTVAAKQARQNVVQVPVTCGLACDTTYRLRVDVKGSPALRFLSHNMYRTLDAYTGCCSTVDPTLQKDPVPSLLQWADQINLSPIFNTMVQARVYEIAVTNTTTSANASAVSTTQATFVPGAFTSIAVGQKVVGTGIPANAFVTTVNGTTNITITYPAQATAPAASVFNALSIKYYNDLYSGAQGTFSYPATAAGGAATVPTVIPGTGSQNPSLGAGPGVTISAGVATNANIAQNLAGTTNGAIIYQPLADAASFTIDAHIELTGAYMETKFGDCTFTPSDKYDLEPLFIYTSLTDESGDPCAVNCFTTSNSNTGANTAANLATIIQNPIQASGIGETVLRNLILSGRYAQNAYPDSSRVESLRMREIEADPMYAAISRTALYDQVMILHSVPRFNNPSGTFDNDQYLLVVNVPTGTTTTAFTNFLVASANAAQGTSSVVLEVY